MSHLCPLCQQSFSHYTEYHAHIAIGGCVQDNLPQFVVKEEPKDKDLGWREYKPLDSSVKLKIVLKVENRLAKFIFGKGGYFYERISN